MRKKEYFSKIKKIANGAVLIGAVIFGCLGLTGCGSSTIDLTKYVTIETTGYDGKGTATASFDSEKFKTDYEKKIKVSDSKNENVKLEKAFGTTDLEIFQSMIRGALDKSSDLSNGDTITYNIMLDDNFETIFKGYSIKNLTLTQKVNGLEQVEKFNAFDEISVSFSGDNKMRQIRITKPTTEMWNTINVTYAPADGSYSAYNKADDKIKVTISYGDETEFIKKYKKIPEQSEKVYTVTSFAEYPKSTSDLSKEFKEMVLNDSKSSVEKNVSASSYANNVKVDYVGSYYLSSSTDKPASIGWGKTSFNMYYLVYKVTHEVVISNVNYGTAVYYKVNYFNNIEKDNLGKFSYSGSEFSYKVLITGGLKDIATKAGLTGYETLEDVDNMINKISSEMKIEKSF